MTNPMRRAVRDVESLLRQYKQTPQAAGHPQQPSDMTTRFWAWLDSGAPALIAVTMVALIALAVGLASAAFAFKPVTTEESVIAKTNPLRTPTSAEIADRGYGQLKNRLCEAAFRGLSPIVADIERHDIRPEKTAEPPIVASELRARKLQRKHRVANRTRYRTFITVSGQTTASLLERFTGVRL